MFITVRFCFNDIETIQTSFLHDLIVVDALFLGLLAMSPVAFLLGLLVGLLAGLLVDLWLA